MPKNVLQDGFNEMHHALLFGWISKAVIERAGGQKGELILRKSVRQYGEERGHRMALRATANGHELSMLNYIAYSEFRVSPGVMEQKVVERSPDAKICISKCPWNTTWKENGLLSFGGLYCLEIDEAVLRGYNPELKLKVMGTQTNGADHCEFIFQGADLRTWNYLLVGYRKTVNPGKKAVLSWDYHTRHLFKTLEENIVHEMGDEGKKAVETGLAEFAGRFGEAAVLKVMAIDI
jgi:hypothetical protein